MDGACVREEARLGMVRAYPLRVPGAEERVEHSLYLEAAKLSLFCLYPTRYCIKSYGGSSLLTITFLSDILPFSRPHSQIRAVIKPLKYDILNVMAKRKCIGSPDKFSGLVVIRFQQVPVSISMTEPSEENEVRASES
jgi:hypothetical protein